ncbi:MAG: hypothetical protein EU530_09060 [Promethearchaeota archaeon]|nr:MAG: hypothetical protein EU530_09060 [Candidatus Lokiarchaeota archaeon]
MKLGDIKPNSTFDAFARVISMGEEKTVTSKKRPLRVCEFVIGDDTAILTLSLFNEQIAFLAKEVGNVIEIIDGWAKTFNGKIQLSLGYGGSWERENVPDFPTIDDIHHANKITIADTTLSTPFQPKPKEPVKTWKISEIQPESNFSAVVRVFYAHPAKTIGKLKVKTFMVGDETGIIPFTTFNQDRLLFNQLMGEIVRLKNCWVKIFNGMIEISKGYKGTWKVQPPSSSFISKEELIEEYQKTQLEIAETLEPGLVYYSCIKGSRFQPSGKTIHKKTAKTKLELVPEPENPYDSNAVGVYCNGVQVGYIPRTQNKAIFKALIDGGPEFDCALGVYTPQNERYTLPSRSKDPLITISTHVQEIEWRPVILYPEDFIVV